MKVLLLAGGLGTRFREETEFIPKPMIEVGGKPMLWHIMKLYSCYGFKDFVILIGYKGYIIKEYFINYLLHQSDVTIDLKKNNIQIHQKESEPWTITLLETGLNTMTGGRIKRAKDIIGNETFMLTYGDGIGDINISNVLESHKSSGKLATVTAVQPSGRFGSLVFDKDDNVTSFVEKPENSDNWINGGFFVLEPQVLKYIEDDSTSFEKEPLETITRMSELNAYKHHGFWRPMDTYRDKEDLQKLWYSNKAPWKIWKG